ncbi:MAG: bifunctional nuclease family protein [Muribaculaceae bacterium]|jgi:bifunctional DNase/RNase|nr:bifunctional nuclease family protein [Muribaculaceae bacterium]
MERVELKVLGITYSQVQAGAYALVLSEVGGLYRIPIVVGIAEAQSIAVRLENIIPPRPMPHDLFVSLAHGFGITLDEVFIYKFEDGIFLSELHFSSEDRQISLDSRTSDAIALALRTDAPIFTTPEILHKTGFIENKKEGGGKGGKKGLDDCTIDVLEGMMKECVEREEYERAAEIKKVITRKRDEQKMERENNV